MVVLKKLKVFLINFKNLINYIKNKNKEYFLDFVENNDSMNVYGPLSMKARPKKHREVLLNYYYI